MASVAFNVQFRSNAMPIRMAVEKTGDCGPNDISIGKATLHGASGSLPLNDRIAIPTGTPGGGVERWLDPEPIHRLLTPLRSEAPSSNRVSIATPVSLRQMGGEE